MTSPGPAPPRGRPGCGIAVLLVLALAVGLPIVRGRSAARSAFDAALAAHQAGDCRRAIEGYDEARRALFSPVREPAEQNIEQCEDYLVAADAGEARDWPTATDGYENYLARYPDSLLSPAAYEAGAAAHLEEAGELLAQPEGGADRDQYFLAVDEYVTVLEEYPDAEAAGQVPQALTAAVDRGAQLAAQQRWCDAVSVLDVFAEASQPPLADAAGRARAALPQSLYECGLQRFAEGDSQTAVTYLRRLGDSYPDDPLTAQARPTLIRAEVAAITAGAAGEVPPLTAVGRAPAGTVAVEVINDSPDELELLFAGPGADAVTIPPCATCSAYPFAPVGACGSGSLPTVSLELPPGSYQLGVRSRSGDDVIPYAGAWELAPGTAYSSCFFIVTSFG